MLIVLYRQDGDKGERHALCVRTPLSSFPTSHLFSKVTGTIGPPPAIVAATQRSSRSVSGHSSESLSPKCASSSADGLHIATAALIAAARCLLPGSTGSRGGGMSKSESRFIIVSPHTLVA